MISQKATGYAGLLTNGTKEQVEAAKASNELSTQNTLSRYEEAKEGIKAEFNGVITSIGVNENESVADGSFLFTIESTEDIVIKEDGSAAGLDFAGILDKMRRKADADDMTDSSESRRDE